GAHEAGEQSAAEPPDERCAHAWPPWRWLDRHASVLTIGDECAFHRPEPHFAFGGEQGEQRIHGRLTEAQLAAELARSQGGMDGETGEDLIVHRPPIVHARTVRRHPVIRLPSM